MFKLIKLILHGVNNLPAYTYEFSEGINYFQGKNDSGKTEFYSFIDYMLGADIDLYKKDWFRDSLDHAELHIQYNTLQFVLIRYIKNNNKNYFYYADENPGEPIRLDEYKERLNRIFSHDEDKLRRIREFVEEDISFRTFTLFNFLGETRHGILNDFFDRSVDIRYALKQPAMLNYIFNRNLAEIRKLKRDETVIAAQIEIQEKKSVRNDDFKARINRQLEVVGIDKTFSGRNAEEILSLLDSFQQSLSKKDLSTKSRTIDELQAVFTSLDEQIKLQSKVNADCRSFAVSAEKQKAMLDELSQLVDGSPSYTYLVEPIMQLVAELEQSISFSKYLLQENTIKELKKQRDKIRNQLQTEESKFRIYTASDKTQAITLIREYIDLYDSSFNSETLSKLKTDLRKIRERIRHLQNANDIEKIDTLSQDITKLYMFSKEVSDFAEYDFSKDGFKIKYYKSGNTLQPQISETSGADGELEKNYYTGSKARHTLIQLCGYLAFLRMLIREEIYPLVPILVIDHISEPFDAKNEKAIGSVLNGAYSSMNFSDLQIFIFDDKNASELGIQPNHMQDLVTDKQSGFNPFYQKPVSNKKKLYDN